MDLLFLVDGSGSIEQKGADNWNLVISFINSLAGQFDIGPGQTRVGMVTFSNKAQIRIKLNEYYDIDAFTEATQNPSFYGGGNTNMSMGLEVAKDSFFTVENGDRLGVPDVVIMLTDGQS
ncbi:hypothetical protein CAPTEDRAFT_56746, partial [Capitella teleta]